VRPWGAASLEGATARKGATMPLARTSLVIDPITHHVNKAALIDIFNAFDLDNNGQLDDKEIDRFMSVLFQMNNMIQPDDIRQKLQNAQRDKRDSQLTEMGDTKQPTKDGMLSCCTPSKEHAALAADTSLSIEQDVFIDRVSQILEEEVTNQLSEEEDEEEVSMSVRDAMLCILWGTILVAFFSDGVVSAIDTFAINTSIPHFVVGFVVCPFASNASELLTSLQFAGAKTERNMSVTFSQIYAACTMNNTLCLGVLLVMIYWKSLSWDYGGEVYCILFTTWAIGMGMWGTTIKYGSAVWILLLYPVSLIMVEMIKYAEGKSMD